ncbi:MAG: hypothetical protein WBO45_03465 [Planctomycetota bacterium]
MWSLLVALAVGACGGPEAPWTKAPDVPLDLRIAVQPMSVPLLTPVTVTLDLFAGPGVEAEFAPGLDAKDFAATTTAAPPVPLFGGTWTRTTLVGKPLRGPGQLTLPPFSCKQKNGDAVATTAEQTITVTSTLVGAAAAIEAPGEPFPTPFHGWWWVAAAGLGVVGLAMVVWLVRGRARVRQHPGEVQVPAHVRALRALERLRAAPRTTPAQIEAFYVEVSAVLRSYLEDRFGLRAPERTTEEFLRELEGGDALARGHRTELERFLSQCDLVKFAAFVPQDGDHLTTWALAEAFVQSTRPDRAVEAVA